MLSRRSCVACAMKFPARPCHFCIRDPLPFAMRANSPEMYGCSIPVCLQLVEYS